MSVKLTRYGMNRRFYTTFYDLVRRGMFIAKLNPGGSEHENL